MLKKLEKTYDIRDLVKVENGRIHINEDDIDLFKYFEEPIKPWKPKIDLPEYSSLTMLGLDIETTGLDPKKSQVVLIGLINEKGQTIIVNCLKDEKKGLEKFLKILRQKNADLLVTFNGFSFDLPFLISRMEKYGIQHPFWVAPNVKTFKTAQIFGKPSVYNDIWITTFPKNKTCVIDLYHQVLAWDFVARKLTKHSLKQSVLQMGLRKEARLELSFEEMMQCVNSGDVSELIEYLQYDLEDTKLLADFLIPSIWYQKMFLPDWKLQSISTAGNGSKWNDVLKKQYLNKPLPETDITLKYEGGLTYAKSGLFFNVSKIDVASLYPSLMLTYGIDSQKDSDRRMLGILQYLKNKRIELKELAKTGNKEANLMQGAMKIMINSAYGALGTTGIEFNDYAAAALVTAHGRAVLKLMMKTITNNGGTLVSCFTADTKVLTDKGEFSINEILNKNVKVLNGVGSWSDTVFTNYGKGKIWKIKLKRNFEEVEIFCTGNHRWIIGKEIITTENLLPEMKIENKFSPKPEKNIFYNAGVIHGIVYGDGYQEETCKDGYRFRTILYGEKSELSKYFDVETPIGDVVVNMSDSRYHGSNGNLFRSSINLKELPSLEMSNEYLYGFICGLIATDGTVNKGTVRITGKLETVEYIQKISTRCGFRVSKIAVSNKAGRETLIKGKKCISKQTTYYVSLEKVSTLKNDLLRTKHRNSFDESSYNSPWRVLNIQETNRFEDVYCCNEPLTHSFVLSNGIITKNCDTDGVFYSTNDPTFELNKAIHKATQDAMPKGINLDYEVEATALFVPPKSEDSEDGLKKNYIIISRDGKVKCKGRYVKRDVCKLQKEFQPKIVSLMVESKEQAEKYYQEVIASMKAATYPIDQLTITRKIRKGEKSLVELGVGNEGEQVSFYRGIDEVIIGKSGKELKKKREIWTSQGEVGWQYYINLVNEMYQEIIGCL